MDIRAYTDGACSGNPGPGGWGVVLIASKRGEVIKEKELSGGELETTNNRMELRAAIEALRALTTPSPITIVTDSVYVKDGITKWVANWQKNGWKTANKKPVKNQELWQELVEALLPHKVRWEWVKGHDGHPENERADKLARQFQENYLTKTAKGASDSTNAP